MEKNSITELLQSIVTSCKCTEEMKREREAQRKGKCGRILGTLYKGFSRFPWKQLDLNAWVHKAVLPGACYWLGGGTKLHFHDSYRLAEQVAFQSDVLAKNR